jgi:hypothetical protein
MTTFGIATLLFVVLLLFPLIGPEPATAVMLFLTFWTLVQLRFRVPKQLLPLIIIPVILLSLGFLGAGSHNLRDIFKDGWYFSFAPIAIVTGYLLARKSRHWQPFLLAFAAAGAVLSFWYIVELAAHRDVLASGDFNGMRDQIGGGFMLSLVAPLILYLSAHYKQTIPGLENRYIRILVYLVTLLSIASAFSRTLIISFIVAVLAGLGWLTLKNLKGILVLCVVIAAIFGLSALVPADTSSLLGKFAQTRGEVSTTEFATTSDITHYWRAFETFMALRTYMDATSVQKSIGLGFGQLVDIGIEMELGGTLMSKIPIFHNGYIYVLLKTGAVGLLLFISYLAQLYLSGARAFAKAGSSSQMLGGLLMSIIAIVVVSTFVVSGWFNPTLMGSVFLLIGGLIGFHETASAPKNLVLDQV